MPLGIRSTVRQGPAGTWKQVKQVTNGKTASWVDTKVTNGVKYRYKVKALYGSAASPLTPEGHRYRVVRPARLYVKSTKARKLTATWSANTKATGYQLCYAANKRFAGSKTLTINGAHSKTKTINGLGTRKEILCEGTGLEEGRSEQLFLRVDGGEAGSCQVIGTEQTADKDKKTAPRQGRPFF